MNEKKINNELEEQKKEFKKSIQELIEKSLLQEAEYMINEYEKVIKNDLDLYSIKSVFYISSGEYSKAKKYIEEGLLIDYRNFDLVFNLAYLYRLDNDYINSYWTFKKAKLYCKDEVYKKEIEIILKQLEEYQEVYLYNEQRKEKKNQYPKVTVIISTYNQKEHLEEAVDSFLCQDYPNLEVMVGDDCSTDGTNEFIKKYREYDEVIHIRHKENLGVGFNSQKLLDEYVDSKYCMLFNHDDYLIKEDYISKAVELLRNNPNLSFVWANCKIKDEINGNWGETNFNASQIINGYDYFINYEKENYFHITGVLTTVFDFEKLKDTSFGREKTKSRDTFLYLKLMLVGDVGFIKDCVGVYRVNKSSISFNMPVELDKSTINEFEILKLYAININILNETNTEMWIANRVFGYVHWRFSTMWNYGNIPGALNILFDIKLKYPVVYNTIVNCIKK